MPPDTDKLRADLRALVGDDPARKALGAAAPAVAIGAARGVGLPAVKAAAGSGLDGGLASPLTEVSVASRSYHTGKYVTTSDGLFTWPAVKEMRFTDASGAAVSIVFASPP
jgi:hypothetical protein